MSNFFQDANGRVVFVNVHLCLRVVYFLEQCQIMKLDDGNVFVLLIMCCMLLLALSYVALVLYPLWCCRPSQLHEWHSTGSIGRYRACAAAVLTVLVNLLELFQLEKTGVPPPVCQCSRCLALLGRSTRVHRTRFSFFPSLTTSHHVSLLGCLLDTKNVFEIVFSVLYRLQFGWVVPNFVWPDPLIGKIQPDKIKAIWLRDRHMKV